MKLIISGCNGHMGRVVASICAGEADLEVAAGIDLLGTSNSEFPVFSSPAEVTVQADALIDFSNPAALEGLLELGRTRRIPLVLATTGYSDTQLTAISSAANEVPIFRSANFSLGVNVLLDLVRRAAAVLGEHYDIELVERHHNRKVDAPSGTAFMIAEAAAEALPYRPEYVYDRQSVRKRRDRHEIGISSVRGGGIVGDHEVIFAGRDEVIEIKHSAMSREVFASGAVQAARFLSTVSKPGLYSMADLVASN
ncbi:MAG: 4-hydroxy-tetrahydrodipicolinate reductase [Oscillospiraceae bacterium]|nr:4-hydroxy-tetrahydrodipicolinate reductase [Oscillospiraceae bacterium]